jgi:hypothetical protein
MRVPESMAGKVLVCAGALNLVCGLVILVGDWIWGEFGNAPLLLVLGGIALIALGQAPYPIRERNRL